MRRRYSAEEKAKWVEGWKASGQTRGAYAQEQGLKPGTLSKWTLESQAGFVEVKRKPGTNFLCHKEIVVEKGGIRVLLPQEISERGIQAAASLLERLA
jgi:transposase-like protein